MPASRSAAAYELVHSYRVQIGSVLDKEIADQLFHQASDQVSYPVFSDQNAATTKAFLATTLPSLYLIDKRGLVRHLIVGVDAGRITQFERKLQELLDEP